ncbi:MAG: hypothetical protein ACLTDI_13640 [Acutalibacteraceae bacterium]
MESQEALVRSRKYPAQGGLGTLRAGVRELAEICRKKKGYGKWYQDLYGRIESDVRTGAMNYPQATLEPDGCHADVSGITSPVVMVISFAPPYYPAFHSDRLGRQIGRDGLEVYRKEVYRQEVYRQERGAVSITRCEKAAEDTCGLCLGKRNYCCGISDLSYCGGPDREEMASYAVNAPSVGNHVPDGPGCHGGFQGPLPFIRPHRQGMRTRCRSGFTPGVLLEEVPVILQQFIEQMFANDIGDVLY